MTRRSAIYSFRFPHHGRYASYHHLVDYLRGTHRIIDISGVPGAFWKCPKLNRIWFRINEFRMLPRFLSARVGCVHYLYPENSLFNATHWSQSKPLLLTWHLPISYINEIPEHVARKQRAALTKASAVIFLSSKSRDEHTAEVDIGSPHVIMHGIDTEYFKFNETTPRSRPLNIITVGSVLRDHRLWAETVSVLLRTTSNICFRVICNERNIALYKRWLSDSDERVSFLGNLSDSQLLAFYAEADIAFLPLVDATANNFLLESMASGIPCVVSDVPAAREYAGDAALYVTNKDSADAVQKLSKLAGSISARRELAFSARRKAENELSWPIIARQHSNVYSQFL